MSPARSSGSPLTRSTRQPYATTGAFRKMSPVDPLKKASPKREDAAVGSDEPVPASVGGRGHPDDRLVQDRMCPVEPWNWRRRLKIPPSDGDHPVAPLSGEAPCRRSACSGACCPSIRGTWRRTEREDPAVGRDHPVALSVLVRRHPDDGFVQMPSPIEP